MKIELFGDIIPFILLFYFGFIRIPKNEKENKIKTVLKVLAFADAIFIIIKCFILFVIR
jgi:hypothetical protein